MSIVINNIKELHAIQTLLDLMSQSGNNELSNLLGLIEESKNTGKLEPENYEQLNSSEYLGNEFREVHHLAYGDQIMKMQQYLSELEKKLNEYLQVC